jgi:hypothetical protein
MVTFITLRKTKFSYYLNIFDTFWFIEVWVLEGAGNFCLHHRVQNGSEAHPVSYPMGTSGSFPGGKAAGAWNWPLTSIQCRGQRMREEIHPLPRYDFMAWCLVKAEGQLFSTPCLCHILNFVHILTVLPSIGDEFSLYSRCFIIITLMTHVNSVVGQKYKFLCILN